MNSFFGKTNPYKTHPSPKKRKRKKKALGLQILGW
jgi:hypothetical protein